jgi:hypothetical protein
VFPLAACPSEYQFFSFAGGAVASLPDQQESVLHPIFEEIVERFGLKLEHVFNKEMLPHLGRHQIEYHEFVLDGVARAELEAVQDAAKFQKLFKKYVKDPRRRAMLPAGFRCHLADEQPGGGVRHRLRSSSRHTGPGHSHGFSAASFASTSWFRWLAADPSARSSEAWW